LRRFALYGCDDWPITLQPEDEIVAVGHVEAQPPDTLGHPFQTKQLDRADDNIIDRPIVIKPNFTLRFRRFAFSS
jgi:hypothetical protein